MLRAISVLVKDSVLYSSSGTLRCHDQLASWVRLPKGKIHVQGADPSACQTLSSQRDGGGIGLLIPEQWREGWFQARARSQDQEGPQERWVVSSHCGGWEIKRQQALVTNTGMSEAAAGDKSFCR